ncbi:MAG: hypothetical protein QM783_05215 [Phycisphaerales bacterium]
MQDPVLQLSAPVVLGISGLVATFLTWSLRPFGELLRVLWRDRQASHPLGPRRSRRLWRFIIALFWSWVAAIALSVVAAWLTFRYLELSPLAFGEGGSVSAAVRDAVRLECSSIAFRLVRASFAVFVLNSVAVLGWTMLAPELAESLASSQQAAQGRQGAA